MKVAYSISRVVDCLRVDPENELHLTNGRLEIVNAKSKLHQCFLILRKRIANVAGNWCIFIHTTDMLCVKEIRYNITQALLTLYSNIDYLSRICIRPRATSDMFYKNLSKIVF